MRSIILLILLGFPIRHQVAAQHPLIGTWEMTSVKGLDADGRPFFLDTTAARETKIITPTHYMLIAWDVDNDSLIFNRTMGGKVALEDEKYIEIPTMASVRIFDNVQADFTWQLKDHVFTQSGSIIRPDGKRVVLEALKFKRVTNIPSNSDNPAIGTWAQVDEYYTDSEKKKTRTFRDMEARLLIVTPTHWIRMEREGDAFRNVAYGTYTMSDNTIRAKTIFSTVTADKNAISEFTQTTNGDKLELVFKAESPQREALTFYHHYQKQR